MASVEHIDKVFEAELDAVRQAMTVEWKTALTQAGFESSDSYMSPEKPAFFANPQRQVQRLRSDPQSPEPPYKKQKVLAAEAMNPEIRAGA